MLREIILDTETTGLSPHDGHRLVEIGAIELVNHMPTDKVFHVYLDPERDMPKEAEAVHGLSQAFLKGKPKFKTIADEFLAFIADAPLIIHNAAFDMGFINVELKAVGKDPLEMGRTIDTLQIAKQRHPMASNSLDALCKRYGVDLSRRTKHGALLDSELLAEVYLELIGGKQTALGFASSAKHKQVQKTPVMQATITGSRPRPLPPRLTEDHLTKHATMLQELGDKALWRINPKA